MSQAEPVTTRPSSIAELRAVTQPPEVRGRRNAEHWTASLYLRNLSPYLTWMLLKTRISANGVTGLMILVGWSTAAALLIPGIWGALLAVVLGQLQMLVDCCDGEVARWRRKAALLKTLKMRPELLELVALTDEESRWLKEAGAPSED